ncbi:OTU domain-containing protein 4 isoform X1 [Manis pentadactyla]|uniref:OTU domain-containing protein 4 isoform X1 n=1 Tax=Manis pentadactyla TaxID=143292 RepID=UPI00255CEA7F|nr:OTU domain-containing protein 4 isoform X1 [Manis pentadactyla]KAI5151921.1 Otu Domain-Containing Protein 4 [Manis pentadactyla]
MEAAVGAPDGGDQGGTGCREDATSMDAYLRKLGLYRKLVAKDGSCLFRAVAEQVLHSQSRHVEVRMACIHYLRENREKFEEFIEGSFEDYLKRLENPQEWVGQVEISALSLMYRKDFIIYREPNVSPSQVTENNFPEKVLLCFSNGNHYDIVYPIKYKESSAMCQSLLYELLYEKVFKTDVSKILMELDTSKGADENNSEVSDSEDDSCRSKTTTANDVNGFKALSSDQHLKNNGNSPSLPLSRKVLKSLNPAVYRNVEYEIWLKSKQAQQKHDYSIAAGLQYEVGDKCQVRLDHNGKFSNAEFQGVHSENGLILVEEPGKKHSPKNLKTPPLESWNTVSGKKMKKPSTLVQNFHSDTDYRGPKNPSKLIKAPSALPPRFQHPSGVRQHAFSGHSAGLQSQKPSSEHKNLRTSSQIIRKPDRERAEDFDHTGRESNYFGLSPEERREKQAIEESRLLYEIQNRDEQAFPALSSSSVSQSASQSISNPCIQRKSSHVSDRKGSRRRMDTEERKDKDSIHGHVHLDKKPEPSTLENMSDDKCAGVLSPSKSKKLECPPPAEQKPAEHVSLSNPAPLLISPEVHLTPAVPSLPATVPAWPGEPTTFGPTGVPTQIPVLSVTQTLTTGPDSAVSQAHLTPSPVPVSIQAVNQPLMPLPQTLSLYQDPLYPGFPYNEKGDRAIAPPYSLCHTGEDLPKDKNILRFFFNLGVKAYSCPMWAPHSYLYPLHQAYLTACRIYPKVPVSVYPQNPWFQEVAASQNESDCTCTNAQFPMQTEANVNGQMPQAEIGPPTFSSPLVIPPSQVSESHGQLSYQADLESENTGQLLHAEYEEPLSGKNMFPQPSFGPNPFLGPVPIAPPFFPHVWYGYPFQGFIENPVMRQNIVVPSDEKELDLPLENLDLSKECGSVSADAFPEARGEGTCPLTEASVSKHEGRAEQSSQTPEADLALASIPPGAEGKAHLPTQILNRERETVPVGLEPKRTIPSMKEKSEKVKDPSKTAAVVVSGANSVDSRVQRPKEESSEDENEVSDILRGGRSKQFYNQTYGGRKYKSDWSYSGRGGYQHARGEESWKGQPSRSRDEGYQYHRNVRGRPYRGDRRRAGMGDGHRGQHT